MDGVSSPLGDKLATDTMGPFSKNKLPSLGHE